MKMLHVQVGDDAIPLVSLVELHMKNATEKIHAIYAPPGNINAHIRKGLEESASPSAVPLLPQKLEMTGLREIVRFLKTTKKARKLPQNA